VRKQRIHIQSFALGGRTPLPCCRLPCLLLVSKARWAIPEDYSREGPSPWAWDRSSRWRHGSGRRWRCGWSLGAADVSSFAGAVGPLGGCCGGMLEQQAAGEPPQSPCGRLSRNVICRGRRRDVILKTIKASFHTLGCSGLVASGDGGESFNLLSTSTANFRNPGKRFSAVVPLPKAFFVSSRFSKPHAFADCCFKKQ